MHLPPVLPTKSPYACHIIPLKNRTQQIRAPIGPGCVANQIRIGIGDEATTWSHGDTIEFILLGVLLYAGLILLNPHGRFS